MDRIQRELIDLFRQGELFADKIAIESSKLLAKEYLTSLNRIRITMSKLMEKLGDNYSYSDAFQMKRLQTIKEQIKSELSKLKKTTDTEIANDIKESYQLGYEHTAYSLEMTLQTQFGFANVPNEQIQASIFNPYNKIKWQTSNAENIIHLNTMVQHEVTQGLIAGKSYQTISAAITRQMNIGAYKSIRIVRTETHRAQQAGRMVNLDDTMNIADKQGIKMVKRWDATLDERTRDNHGHMDGQVTKDNFKFITMDGQKIDVLAPGITGTTDDINCRCQLTAEIEDLPPKIRKDNITKDIIPYQTYDQWVKGKF